MINRTLTTEEIDLLVDFAREYLQFAEEFAGPNYGPFCGGDPRNFEPDPEASTEQQRERHRKACEAWERGERGPIATGFGFGAMHDRAQDERCRRLRRLLEELE